MVKRLVLVGVITLGLFGLWNWSVLLSLLQPTLIRQGVVNEPKTDQIADNSFQYGSLGIVAPITVNAGTSPLVEADWSVIRESLRQGVSLAYDGTNFVDANLAFLTGHSSDFPRHNYDSIFASLGQAKIGDTFQLAVGHDIYQYRVSLLSQLAPGDADAFLALAPAEGPKRLALVTCWPPLTTKMRMVVVGERL